MTNYTIQIFLGSVVQVMWSGYNFGASPLDVTLKVAGFPCSTILNWSPSTVKCIMRLPVRTLSQDMLSAEDMTIETLKGVTKGKEIFSIAMN